MKIEGKSYSVLYDVSTATVIFQGSLRLSGAEEYAPIEQILNSVTDQDPSIIILNLQKLEFLNSSGISMLSKFVINVRKKKNSQMIVIGSQEIPWQGKSLKNLQRLMPSLKLEII
ncbi:STAS domain-containing protein [Gloeocapsopsis sp. IPPAS B-1203]|uniref:slr1659 superfamily regulator n=1 Tax=Gloeocapsopsis sp. IPPAS B-1203 TaxID=2049454 RepID=UPI000C19B22B|nr:STAS domain-containing protein [Gloeocapsopsis sp. IPPAS B-1203]PIG93065.1 hypothetical protein CSQ79_12720 [Gloeocapsopsis sp. IPPAS B-1203]